MAETIFCIADEQRQRMYSDLRSMDEIRTMLARQGLKWEPYELELRRYIQGLRQLLESLPLDPRCAAPPATPMR